MCDDRKDSALHVNDYCMITCQCMSTPSIAMCESRCSSVWPDMWPSCTSPANSNVILLMNLVPKLWHPVLYVDLNFWLLKVVWCDTTCTVASEQATLLQPSFRKPEWMSDTHSPNLSSVGQGWTRTCAPTTDLPKLGETQSIIIGLCIIFQWCPGRFLDVIGRDPWTLNLWLHARRLSVSSAWISLNSSKMIGNLPYSLLCSIGFVFLIFIRWLTPELASQVPS